MTPGLAILMVPKCPRQTAIGADGGRQGFSTQATCSAHRVPLRLGYAFSNLMMDIPFETLALNN